MADVLSHRPLGSMNKINNILVQNILGCQNKNVIILLITYYYYMLYVKDMGPRTDGAYPGASSSCIWIRQVKSTSSAT